MNKKIIIFSFTLITVTLHGMEQTLIQFDQLPQHELNIVAAHTKRPGKDALRCVNKNLNNKIISQDQLYALYAKAKETKNETEMCVLSTYSTFTPHIHHEVIDAIENNNEKLTVWCLNKMPFVNPAFLHLTCIERAVKKGNVNMVKMLFKYCGNDSKYFVAADIVRIASKYGYLDIIKAFIEAYKTGVDFDSAIYFAKTNGHREIAEYLESKKPNYGYSSKKKSDRY